MYRFSYWGIQFFLFVIVFWCVHWIHFLYSSLFIQVLCGYVWGWSQWLRSTESSSRWNLPVRSRSFRSISIYLQTTQHWVCPNTHTVNSVICILQRQINPHWRVYYYNFPGTILLDGLIIFWSNCCGSYISLFAVNCKKNNKIC